RDAAGAAGAKKQVVEERHQRSALSAGSDIGDAKIRDDRDAQAGGDHGTLAGLPGGGNGAPEKSRGLALMVDGLTVAADEFSAEPGTLLGLLDGGSVEFA